MWLAIGRWLPEPVAEGKVLDDSRVLRQLLIQVHASTGSHHLETRIKKAICRTKLGGRLTYLSMIGDLTAQRSRLLFFLLINCKIKYTMHDLFVHTK
jgi:hypothetical protein